MDNLRISIKFISLSKREELNGITNVVIPVKVLHVFQKHAIRRIEASLWKEQRKAIQTNGIASIHAKSQRRLH